MGKNKENSYEIAIIGAGASGLMAAITAARAGKSVVLLEHKERIGKKIPATGNGKCNYTNENMQLSAYRGNIDMVSNAFECFDKARTIAFFKELSIYPKCKNGYYYPNSEQASSVLQALEMEVKRLRVQVITEINVKSILPQKYEFEINTDDMQIMAERIIVATGLKASPKLGSDGSFFSVIKSLGHHFTPVVPALCGFEANGCNFKKVSGVRAEGRITLYIDGKEIVSDQGEIQLADYGISGIPVFQVSRYASLGLYEKKKVTAILDFLPNMNKEELQEELSERFDNFKNTRNLSQILNGLLNQKLSDEIIRLCGFVPEAFAKQEAKYYIPSIVSAIKEFQVQLMKSRSNEFAQICAGGVCSDEVDAVTLESKLVPGVFFCGEVLDVDGICGGYNLQWAWSSGYVAAQGAVKVKEKWNDSY